MGLPDKLHHVSSKRGLEDLKDIYVTEAKDVLLHIFTAPSTTGL